MINWPSSEYEASWSKMVHLRKVSGKCKYFSVRHILANSVDPDQSDPGLHCLPFHRHLLDRTHYPMVRPPRSNFRAITANCSSVRILMIFFAMSSIVAVSQLDEEQSESGDSNIPADRKPKKTSILDKITAQTIKQILELLCDESVSSCFMLYRNDSKVLDRWAWANNVDPDQTAPRGAVWSGSTLFAIPSASFGLITLW